MPSIKRFGLDRQASQLFFVAPVQIETVLRAKNAVALCLIALQTLAVLGFVLLIRIHVKPVQRGGRNIGFLRGRDLSDLRRKSAFSGLASSGRPVFYF